MARVTTQLADIRPDPLSTEDQVRSPLSALTSSGYSAGMAPIDGDIWKDWARCDRARLARDPRFDGLFFTCVKTTRIYCRPVCPVAPALSKNVFYVASASAAERLGFRPCLRCRPESAPGSPAWQGTRSTVSRALRMIDDGYLDSHSVEELAEGLGVTARHVARLFARHLDASPTDVAATKRVQRAKRLIDQTDLPMSAIAFDAGFGSVRRFNEAFKDVYRLAPSDLRRRPAKARP